MFGFELFRKGNNCSQLEESTQNSQVGALFSGVSPVVSVVRTCHLPYDTEGKLWGCAQATGTLCPTTFIFNIGVRV